MQPAGAYPTVVCKVCTKQFAQYTCPRCNARYCSLQCYKAHSGRCTEEFSRESVAGELRGLTATDEQKRAMEDILRRLHEQEIASGSGEGSSGEEGAEEGAEEEEEVRSDEGEGEGARGGGRGSARARDLSRRLMRQLQQRGGGGGDAVLTDADVDALLAQLTPEDLEEFERDLCAGRLAGLVEAQGSQPWWLGREATALRLAPRGTALVREQGEDWRRSGRRGMQQLGSGDEAELQGASSKGDDKGGGEHQGESSEEGGEGGGEQGPEPGYAPPPAPPSEPLPPLHSLTRVAPSPLLRWQLLEVLYAYCLVHRLYCCMGHWRDDAPGAAAALLASAAALAAGPGEPVSATPGQALGGCVAAALAPQLLGPGCRGPAVGLLSDLAALLALGRPGVVVALADVSRLVSAASDELCAESSSSPPPPSSPAPCRPPSSLPPPPSSFQAAQRLRQQRLRQLADGASASAVPAGASALTAAVRQDGGNVQEQRQQQRRGEREAAGGRRQLAAAVRKLVFLQSWANEQPPDAYRLLEAAAREEAQGLAATLSQPDPGRSAIPSLHGITGGAAKDSVAQRAVPEGRSVIEVIGGGRASGGGSGNTGTC